ncbi:MAG: hypothetical protein GF344_03715 [Chitinivibrionales bacterium]|nr:hypothetical protein [Chitinivibrionales bacterium]
MKNDGDYGRGSDNYASFFNGKGCFRARFDISTSLNATLRSLRQAHFDRFSAEQCGAVRSSASL